MELYKNINNEALEEDLRAKKIVMERLRRQIQGTEENFVKMRELAPDEKVALGKLILSFNNSLDQLLYGEDRFIELGEMPYKYNLIAFYLKKLPMTDLDEIDKRKIYDEMQRFIPKLNALESYANVNNISDAFLIPLIKDNIVNKTFNTLTDLPEDYNNKNKVKQKPGPKPKEPNTRKRAAAKKAADKAAEKAAKAIAEAQQAKEAEQQDDEAEYDEPPELVDTTELPPVPEITITAPEEEENTGSGKKYKKVLWEMHSLSIDKLMSLKEAKALAKKIFKETPKHVEEQAKTWHFNKNKKELFKKFRAHKVNDFVNIIFGQLK